MFLGMGIKTHIAGGMEFQTIARYFWFTEEQNN